MTGLAAATASATVDPYCWIRGGEQGIMVDASGKNHNFNAAFSCLGGGNPAAIIQPIGAGGPLGTTTQVSTRATRWGSYGCTTAGMWIEGPAGVPSPEQWSLPATNWVMEGWVLPVDDGAGGGNTNSQLFSTGSGQHGGTAGGAAILSSYNFDETMTITAVDIGLGEMQIGDAVIIDTKSWTHLAVVNDNGNVTFYVNGVASGAPLEGGSAPSGVPYIGSGQDTHRAYDGYLDEVRYSTFADGAFQVSDLLTRPPGPNIIAQPESAEVWMGGPAPFEVKNVFDASTTYQWKVGPDPINGATAAEYVIPAVTADDNGDVFSVLVRNQNIDLTSENATLTVVPVKTADAAFYREEVENEASLVAYFPADGDSVSTLTNTKNAAFNAVLQEGASFDGRTDRSYGVKALRLKSNSEASVQPNPAYEFKTTTGGTVEAIVYLGEGSPNAGNHTLFSIASGSAGSYLHIQTNADGTALLVGRTDPDPEPPVEPPVSWTVADKLAGRKAHVAVVFGTDNTVTAYVDGVSLGTKPHMGYGLDSGHPLNIGSMGLGEAGWFGTIDELAIYNAPLSATEIAVHNSRFAFGTAVTPPVIESQTTGTRNLLAGGAPVLSAKVTGPAPMTYQWKRNGEPVTNNPTATTPTLVLDNSTVAMSGNYTLTATNPQGEDVSDPVTMNFAAPSGLYASYVLADNPSAYWRMNEAAGATVMKDSAGGLDGTYSSSLTLGVPGTPGTSDTAVQFPGAGPTPTPNAVVPYTPVLNPATPYTVEFWAKPGVEGTTTGAVISTQNRNADRSGYVVYQGFNAGRGWEAHIGWDTSVLFIWNMEFVAANEWDHIVVTWDGINASRLYINGVDATDPGSSTGAPHKINLVQPLEIGSRFNGGQLYNGVIDEVAFYNHVLSPERIAVHASIITNPPTEDPVMNPPVYNANGTATLSWTAPAGFVLQESLDMVTWTAVPNATSPYTTPPLTGRKFYRAAQP